MINYDKSNAKEKRIKKAPERGQHSGGVDMESVPTTRSRMERILKEAVERYEHEILPDEERMLLLDRIRRLRRKLLAS
jgi:hypothetical protein